MTSTIESIQVPEILKTDQLGRVRTPAAKREAILDEFEGSGMSGQAFAKQFGIKYSTFASWVQRRREDREGTRKRAPKGSPEVTFLEAEIAGQDGSAPGGSIEVESPEGLKVRLQRREQIALAVECLRAFQRRS